MTDIKGIADHIAAFGNPIKNDEILARIIDAIGGYVDGSIDVKAAMSPTHGLAEDLETIMGEYFLGVGKLIDAVRS